MSSTAAEADRAARKKRDVREFAILIAAGIFAGAFGWALRPHLRIFSVLELVAICSSAVLALFNYFRLYDSLNPGIVTEDDVKTCKRTLNIHVAAMLGLFVACYFSVLLSLRPFVLSGCLAAVYFMFVLSNRSVLGLVGSKCSSISDPSPPELEDSAYQYTLVTANSVYFYREENIPSLAAYITLTMFCAILPLLVTFTSMFNISDLQGIRSLAAGAALFHLGLSTIRFRRIFSSSDDAIEKLVKLGIHDSADGKHAIRLKGACQLSKAETGEHLEKWPLFWFIGCALLGAAAYIVTSDAAISGSDENANATSIHQ